LWGGCRVLRDRAMIENFTTISDGITRDQVRRIQCAETYMYASAWAPPNPEYPVVWFDRRKQVIGKFDFASP
jgi:hypothetical protein